MSRRRKMGRRGDAPDRQPGDRRRPRQDPALRRGRDDPRDRSGAARLRPVGEDAAEGAGADPAPVVRPHHPEPRRHRPHHDQRAGQAPCGGAGRGRLRRRLHRVLRRGGQAHLWRDQSDLPRRFAHCRHQAADRRGRGDHAVEFPRRDDHPQGGARARRRLHRGGEARGRDAADRARAWRACASRRHAARRPQPRHRRRARDRQGDDRPSGRARDRLHRLDRGRQGARWRRRRAR